VFGDVGEPDVVERVGDAVGAVAPPADKRGEGSLVATASPCPPLPLVG
jgi:hypothetical protein